MNWDAIGALSGLFSAVALIATLVYLAVQIRQNTFALKSAATQGTHDQLSTAFSLLASDPALTDIFARGLEAPDTLDRIQTGRFYALLAATMMGYQNWFLQTRSHALDSEHMDSWLRVIEQLSGMPGFKKYWADRRYMYTDVMVQFLEQDKRWGVRDPDFHPLGIQLAGPSP